MSFRRKLLLGILFFILSLPLVLYGLLFFFSQNLQQYVVAEINKELNTEVVVKHIDLQILNSFPNVTLTFEGVEIKAPPYMNTRGLLKAGAISLRFNFWNIINRNYQVSSIILRETILHPIIDSKGRANYHILKPGKEQKNALTLKLNHIYFNKLKFTFENKEDKQLYNFDTESLEVAGQFSDNEYDLSLAGNLLMHKACIEGINYISEKVVAAEVLLRTDNLKDIYILKKGNLQVEQMNLSVTGNVQNQKEGLKCDLKFSGQEMTITSLLSLIPGNISSKLEGYKSTGNIFFNGSIRGNISQTSAPLIQVEFGIQHGALNKPGLKATLQDIELNGSLKTDGGEASELLLNKLSCTLGNSSVTGELKLTHFADPIIKTSLLGTINLEELLAFMPNKHIQSMSGEAEFKFLFQGKASEFSDSRQFIQSKNEGYLKLRKANVQSNGYTLAGLDGTFQFNSKTLELTDLSGDINGNLIRCSGRAEQVSRYIFSGETLKIRLDVKSPQLDLDNLIINGSSKQGHTDSTSENWFPRRIASRISLKAETILYKKFRGKQVKGVLYIDEKSVQLPHLKMNTMEGSIELKDCELAEAKHQYGIQGSANLHHVNISEAFYTFNEFGQNTLVSTQLKGYLDAEDLRFSLMLNEKGEVMSEKVYIIAKLKISNGELNNFEPVQKLSKFADVNELKNLKFQALENTIEIKKRIIYLPQMDIRNNALNITISGTHSFDNYMDYRLKLRLSQVILRNRNKASDKEFGEYEEGEKRGLNLYIHMKGTPEKLDISYDKIGARKKLKEDFHLEKSNIKELFKKEFGTPNDRELNPSQKDTVHEEPIKWED